jgi:soluble lytic murein transglycosylase-like protein
MNQASSYAAPVVWRTSYDRLKDRWKTGLVFMNLFYLAVISCLGSSLILQEKRVDSVALQKKNLEELRTREAIYSILKGKGISLSQGIDIAEVVVTQSKKLDIPISLILAVMKKESMFNPIAVSSQSALGLMQVHPVTWNEYAAKLKLNVSTYAAFDPVTNVIVATNIIKDLYDHYRETASSDSDLWESVLSAYYAGRTAIAQNGIDSSHRRYVADVNRFKSEFEKKLREE